MVRAGSAAAGRPQRKRPWRPTQRLALSVRLIGGESTGSYTRRLADANGIPDQEFWPMFGTPLRKAGVPGDPRYGDGYLNTAALDRLVVMTARSVGELQSALPNLRANRLLTAAGGPAWQLGRPTCNFPTFRSQLRHQRNMWLLRPCGPDTVIPP